MAIIIAHGGRFFAWDNPTPESGLLAPRYEMMARVVTPFLRTRQAGCLGSRALPDISLFHGPPRPWGFSIFTSESCRRTACRVSLRLPQRPLSVTPQPQGKAITDWTWRDGQLEPGPAIL